MSTKIGADVLDVGMVTTVGLRTATAAAAVRAGINRFRESMIPDRLLRPIVMGHLPDEDLPPLSRALKKTPDLFGRRARMLRLAGTALCEALAREDRVEPIPLLLALPDAHPGRGKALAAPADESFLVQLATQADRPFDVARSKVLIGGRAAVFPALAQALALLRSGAAGRVLVGGVDTHFDLDLLLALEGEGRICARGVGDTYVPGEGAAFLLLTTPGGGARADREAIARIAGAAHALEPGHRYSEVPHRGDGLAEAFEQLFDKGAARAPVKTVYAGLNGEYLTSKEWGVASLRHRDRIAEDAAIETPADCLGDAGAALGPLLLALAAIGVKGGYRRSPCLVWSASDKAERGAAIVDEV